MTRWCLYEPIQTKSLWSTKRPCGFLGNSDTSCVSGSPQACTTSPSESNSITIGAGTQHSLVGGSWTAPVSSSVSVSLRWVTQTWSCTSTKTDVTAPMIQSFGISCGQVGSTSCVGTTSIVDDDIPSSESDPKPHPAGHIQVTRSSGQTHMRRRPPIPHILLQRQPTEFILVDGRTRRDSPIRPSTRTN